MFELACDDGDVSDGDGCDMNCTIEDHYVCINGTPKTPSICSYTGPIEFTVQTAYKDPLSNSMNLTYKVSPIAPLLILTNDSTDFTSLVSYPGFEINVTSATLNS